MKKVVSILVLLAVIVTLFVACGGKSLDVFDHMTVEFSGLDGNGKAKVIVDDSFEKALFTAGGYKEGKDPFEYLALYAAVDYNIDKKEGLSNGDKVTVTLKTEEAILKEFGVSISKASKDFKVEGLGEGTTRDLFQDMELVIEGESPFLRVKGESRSGDSFLKTVQYVIEDNTNRQIGDEVVVKANYNVSKAEEEGYLISETEKTVVIEKADKIIEDFGELTEEFIKKLASETSDTTVSAFAKYGGAVAYTVTDNSVYSLYGKSNEYGDPEMQQVLLLSPKANFSGYTSSPGSTLYVGYTVEVKGKDGISDVVPVLIKVPGVILKEDGTVTAAFEKMDYYYEKKVTDVERLLSKIEDENKANYVTEIKWIGETEKPSKKDDKKESSTKERYLVEMSPDMQEEYYPAIVLMEDGRFQFIVNLLHGMGKMEGTYTEAGDVITLTPDKIDFGGSKGEDVISFTLSKKGEGYSLGNIEIPSESAYANNGIGGSTEEGVFVLVEEKPLSVEKN